MVVTGLVLSASLHGSASSTLFARAVCIHASWDVANLSLPSYMNKSLWIFDTIDLEAIFMMNESYDNILPALL